MAIDKNGDEWVFELKVDGYRLLIHVSDGEARAFTRRKKDVTHSLPELNEIEWSAGDYIIDCEVIASDGKYSTTSSRVGKKPENIDHNTTMEFACFDLVYANGDISRKNYKQRRKRLERVVKSTDDKRVYELDVTTDRQKAKAHARKNGYEGIIAKKVDAEYKFATRTSNWIKSKNQDESVDAKIVAFEEGDGRLDGTLGTIEIETADGVPLGRVGTGFTDEERDEIWENRGEWMNGTVEIVAEAYDEGLRFPRFERDRRDDGEPDTLEKVQSVLEVA